MTAPRQYPSQERLRELFDYDPNQGLLIRKGKCRGAARRGINISNSYRRTTINYVQYQHHRLVWIWHNDDPGQIFVDHINRDRNDDRIENLRLANDCENNRSRGMQKNNTSGYKGVFFEKSVGRWKAGICLNGKSKHLGIFPTKEEAAACYQKAATELHGEFAGAFS